MAPLPRASLRRLAAAATIPLVLLLSACGVKQDYTIDKDGTVDVTYSMWDDSGSGYLTRDSCSASNGAGPTGGSVTYVYSENDEGDPTCTMKAKDLPLSSFDGSTEGLPTITHQDGRYTFTQQVGAMAQAGQTPMSSATDISVTVTFPGKVVEASGNASKDGRTVTWSDVSAETASLRAVGSDGSTSPLTWVALGLLLVLLVAGGVVLAVVLARRNGRRAGAAVGAQYGAPVGAPGVGPYTGQPGAPFGAPVPGAPSADPYRTGPGAPQGRTGQQGVPPVPQAGTPQVGWSQPGSAPTASPAPPPWQGGQGQQPQPGYQQPGAPGPGKVPHAPQTVQPAQFPAGSQEPPTSAQPGQPTAYGAEQPGRTVDPSSPNPYEAAEQVRAQGSAYPTYGWGQGGRTGSASDERFRPKGDGSGAGTSAV